MNIISYSLFGEDRSYFYPLPYIIAANSIIYSGFKNVIYIHKQSLDIDLSIFLKELQILKPDILELKIIDCPYKNLQPTLWRMMPLWDKNVDILLCRDVDSATTSMEAKSVYTFMRSDYMIHGIRSYKLHSTKLMAGLCGFKCNTIRNECNFLTKSFDDYVEYCRGINPDFTWGCDQKILDYFFYKNNHMDNKTFDDPVQTAPLNVSGFCPGRIDRRIIENTDLSFIENKQALDIGDTVHDFIASPFKRIEKYHIHKMLDINCDNCKCIKDIILKHENTKIFWGYI